MCRTEFVVPLLNHFHAQMKQFVSRVQSVGVDYPRLPMSTSLKTERRTRVDRQRSTTNRSRADFRSAHAMGAFPQESAGKQNFNYCNESYRRGTESVAFVWSLQEFVLASSVELIYHRRDSTVCFAVVERATINRAGRISEQKVCHLNNNNDEIKEESQRLMINFLVTWTDHLLRTWKTANAFIETEI